MDLIAALDIGGTKLAAGLVASDGSVVDSATVPTRATVGPDDLFADVVRLVAGICDRAPAGADLLALGVGCGGPMDRTTVSPLNIPAWREFPLADRLDAALGDRFAGIGRGAAPLRVAVDNDAKALALAEGWIGAAAGHRNYLGMVVSTGVGGGIVLDGRLLDGRGTNAGHIGHVCAVPGGQWCGCGARGCVEAEASGTAIARKAAARWRAGALADGPLRAAFVAARNAGAAAGNGVALTTVDGIAGPDVVRAAQAGDPAAIELFAEAGDAVGRAIGSVAALLDLPLAVVGGGIGLGAGEVFWTPMRNAAAAAARISFVRDLDVIPAALGAEAGLVGAARVVLARGGRADNTPQDVALNEELPR